MLIAWCLLACARTAHVPVDLELLVDAPLPDSAAQVRICTSSPDDDGPSRTFGAGDGRYALTGVPADPDVIVDVLDGSGAVIGRGEATFALPTTLGTAALETCDGCAPCDTGDAVAGDPLVLGVRFQP